MKMTKTELGGYTLWENGLLKPGFNTVVTSTSTLTIDNMPLTAGTIGITMGTTTDMAEIGNTTGFKNFEPLQTAPEDKPEDESNNDYVQDLLEELGGRYKIQSNGI